MADSSRTDSARPAASRPDTVADTKIEQLLLSGLDRYFAGEYEQAISVWTRVLFIDRSHNRARAYIERARSAIAERQRESEELVHRGVDAFGRGDAAEARSLLIAALDRGGPHEVAFTFLDRLDRLPQPPPQADPRGGTRLVSSPPKAVVPQSRSGHPWIVPAIALVVAITAGFVVVQRSWDRIAPLLFAPEENTGDANGARPAARQLPPLPRPADIALERARALRASGRLHEALAALAAIETGDRLAADADRLRAEIQRALLAGADSGIPRGSADR
ncbi:MAG: hypothetical protein ACE148_01695 [Vicinamibacterales bacterium]